MARRQQLPPQIKKIDLTTRERGKPAVRYQVTVDAGTDPETGRRRQTRRRFRTENEAREYLSTTTGDVVRGTHVAPSKLTVERAVAGWLASQRVKETTLAAYTAALQPVVRRFGDEKIQTITKDDIELLIADLREGRDGEKTWKATSINPMVARLRSVMADLQAQGRLVRNPAALIKPIPQERIEYKILTDKQVADLYAALREDRLEHIWRLALLGLRRGELAGARWSNVDLEEGTLTLSRNRVAVNGRAVETTLKTKTSKRVLPLPADIVPVLHRARTRAKGERLAAGSAYAGDSDGYLLADRLGRPVNPGNVSTSWRDMLTRYGLPHVRLHDARHTCASRLLAEGVDPATVAAWMGHKSAAVTLAIYAHSTPDRLRGAADVLDASSG